MKIGFHASHEQWPPGQLLRQVEMAESAGFAAAMCSDHFHPWLTDQGQSGFNWSWLGAAMARTRLSFGTVCAPGQRYHPAMIAQAAATLAEMFPNRFWLSVGSGEFLNESITGQDWPRKSIRNQRLKECVEIFRRLWAGELVDHEGLVTVRHARLYTRPAEPPPIIGAALSAETAEWMAPWVDGLITAGSDKEDLRRIVDAFRRSGGEGKPLYLQTALSFEASDDESSHVAWKTWRQAALNSRQLADLSSPEAFDAAARSVTEDDVANSLRVSSDIQQHLAWLRDDRELGFDAVYLHFLGSEVERFIREFAAHVLPEFQGP